MKLSDIDPSEVETASPTDENPAPQPGTTLSLSALNPSDISYVASSPEEAQYGGLTNMGLTALESVPFGGVLDRYLAQYNPSLFASKEVRARAQENPISSLVGSGAGGAALLAATSGFGGIAAAIEAGVGGLAGTALGAAAEGAIFGAGNVISDAALGDPNLNAQKILSDIGTSAALGGGLGVLSKAISAVPALQRIVQAGEKEKLPIPEEGKVTDVLFKGKPPTSLEDMQARTEAAERSGKDLVTLPQRAEADQANSRMAELQQFPISQMQMDSLNSEDARRAFKTMIETPGKDGEILRNYQGAQKKELLGVLDDAIGNQIAPGYDPTTDAVEAGERAAQSFTNEIQKNRDELGPAFEAIKSTPLNSTPHLPGILDYLTNPESSPYANPKIANAFDTSGSEISFKPYSTSMGIDHSTYRAVKQAVDALQENPDNFEQLFDIRKGLSQHVDVTKLGDASKEISAAKAAMMDYIQDAVQEVNPTQQVRDVFKKWAVNEQNAQMIEKRFGAEIGSNNWRSLAKGGDESILKKIFRDSDSVAAAKVILPERDFNQMLADHLSILRSDATDKGVFSSNKFFSNIRRNQYALGEAFADNGPTYQKIKDSMTLLRIFEDDRPQNPSGTTKTLLQALANGGLDPFKHFANLAEYGKGKWQEALQHEKINQALAGQADNAKKLTSIQGIVNRVDSQIKSGVASLFKSGGATGAALGVGSYLSDKQYDKMTQDLNTYYSNPQSFMDELASNSESLYSAAPNITQGIHQTMMTALQFLQSKLPHPDDSMPLTPDWQPSKMQKATFQKYYQGVNEPLEALKQTKQGTLSNETLEALQAVHPALLQEMRQKVVEKMDVKKLKTLPYAQKLSLAKFLGQPLDRNMLPQTIQSNQISFNMPRQSQQSTPQSGRKTRSSSLGGLKQLDFSKRSKTPIQREQDEI